MLTHVEISSSPIDLTLASAKLNNQQHGGVNIFIGRVREYNLGRQVIGVEYEVFKPLALTILNDLCSEIRKTISDDVDICIIHARGYLRVGDISVIIAVSSTHRNEAFVVCRQLIEKIKHYVPIWKQEHYIDGKSEWVKGHSLCQHG